MRKARWYGLYYRNQLIDVKQWDKKPTKVAWSEQECLQGELKDYSVAWLDIEIRKTTRMDSRGMCGYCKSNKGNRVFPLLQECKNAERCKWNGYKGTEDLWERKKKV